MSPSTLVRALAFAACFTPLTAAPTPDADDGGLLLPPGFRAQVVADDLMANRRFPEGGDMLRFLSVAPNGDLFAKSFRGGILALSDSNDDGRYDVIKEFGHGGGTGIAVHGDWLYYSTNSAVYRYPYRADELVPSGSLQTIVEGLEDTGTHNAKAFTFDGEGRLLVEQGCGYNVYSDPDRQFGAKGKDATEYLKTHGGYWRFDANRQHQTLADGVHFSTGHRHSLAIAWQPVSKQFFMAMMGRDNMNVVAPEFYDALDNAERVSEEMHRLYEGVNLGWPYTYWDPIKKARMISPEFGGDGRKRAEVGKYDEPVIAFPAHWAPLQMTFYTGAQFPERYRGGAFIAFHGSWNRAPLPQDGFNICFVPFDDKGEPTGSYEVFAANAGPRRFRMGGVAVGPDGSLYVSETDKGRIWRITYTGDMTSHAVVSNSSLGAPVQVATPSSRGGSLFAQNCATCHMLDGSGAGQQNPALRGSAVVAGDLNRVIQILLRGPAEVLPKDRPQYANKMPAFSGFTDAQIADLVTYVRQQFGSGASAATTKDVAAQRALLP